MVFRVSRRCLGAVGAALIGLQLGGTAPAQNLVANPLLERDLPPVGWLGEHRETWIKQHAVYASTCATSDVAAEIRYLNRAIAYDEYLLSLADAPDTGNPVTARLAHRAKSSPDGLRKDISTADGLIAQLRLLPLCGAGAPQPQPATAIAIATPPSPAPAHDAVAAPPAPPPLATPPREASTLVTPAPPASPPPPAPPPAVLAATEPAALSAPPAPTPPIASAAAAPAPPSTPPASAPSVPASSAPDGSPPPAAIPGRLVIRFDDKVAALTPSGIRAFNEAVAAARSGKPVQLAIEGCEVGADFSNGSPCARRRASLERRLAEAGVKDPKRLFSDLR